MASTRGRYMKDYLAAVRRLPPSKQEAVLQGLDELVATIENAGSLEWLPVTVNLHLTQAIFEKLGDEGADSFFQNWTKRQMSAPGFAGLVRTALSLFRFETAAVARWIPKVFDLMYRDYGSFAFQNVSPLELHVMLAQLPRELLIHPWWPRSVCSGMYALYFLTGVKGTVELAEVSPLKRSMRLVFCWTE
jgi:hypothetical protein